MSIYNESLPEIRQSLESVINQTYSDFECIVVVDHPDRHDVVNYLEKVREKDKRLVIIRNKENIGLAESMNKAAGMAEGKYLARMDADDVCLKTRLEKQYVYMEQYGYDLTCTDFDFIDESGSFLDRRVKTWKEKDMGIVMPFMNPIHHPTVMMTRVSMLAAGGYRNFPCAQDYDLWLRMWEQGVKMGMVGEKLLHYRLRRNNVSALNGFKQIATIWYIQELYRERKEKGRDSFSPEHYVKFLENKHILDVQYLEKAGKDKQIKDQIDCLRKKRGRARRTAMMVKLFRKSPFYREYYRRLFLNKLRYGRARIWQRFGRKSEDCYRTGCGSR